jgi:hypothetical protein
LCIFFRLGPKVIKFMLYTKNLILKKVRKANIRRKFIYMVILQPTVSIKIVLINIFISVQVTKAM